MHNLNPHTHSNTNAALCPQGHGNQFEPVSTQNLHTTNKADKCCLAQTLLNVSVCVCVPDRSVHGDSVVLEIKTPHLFSWNLQQP